MGAPRWEDLVVVARIARPHGLRGEVILNPETDFAEDRFRPGRRLYLLEGASVAQVTVRSVWFQRARPVIALEGVESIEQAELLAGRELRIEASELTPLPQGVYYQHDLVGFRVVTVGGIDVGTVARVDGGGSATRLVVDGPAGEVLVPLAVDICRRIDTAAREIVIDAPDGLLDLNAVGRRRARRGWRR